MTSPRPPRQSQNFFRRENDGSVRLRIRFTPEQAARFEEAAGTVPVMEWIHRTLDDGARRQVEEARAARTPVPPPE